MSFYGLKADAAQYVNEMLDRLDTDSVSIMTITRDTSEAYSVNFVIAESSEDLERQVGRYFLKQLQSI